MFKEITMIKKIALFSTLILLTGCSSIQLSENTQSPNKSYSTVNGSINVGSSSSINNASTVNGSIYFDSNISIASAETVNGRISASKNLTASGSLVTVNGNIILQPNTKVAGRVETVNGDITLDGVEINHDVVTVNGDLFIVGNTHIKGNVLINNAGSGRIKSVFWDSTTEVNIGPNVIIDGVLRYQRNVSLNIDPAAKINKIIHSSDLK
jgi:DUF4097 and DUF4098 domain-containing protein YvlB